MLEEHNLISRVREYKNIYSLLIKRKRVNSLAF